MLCRAHAFTLPSPGVQAIVYWGCLAGTMALCATRVAAGRLTIGDAVAINGLLIQLHSPLTALGYTYQEIRQVRRRDKKQMAQGQYQRNTHT
jgi:ABC-type transport system involved in Fe-S cluster assembly fused permease/ATPase subunit